MDTEPARPGLTYGAWRLPAGRALRLRLAVAVEAVFGPDPGLLRLQVAGRAVLSAALTLAVLLLLMDAGAVSVSAIALSFMLSVFASVAVRDPEARQQSVTLLLLSLPALVMVALAAFLSRWQWLADLGFIAVIFGATLARAGGVRGMALGMVAYISYFIGEIIHPAPAQMPGIVLGIAVALGFSALVRFVVLPDRRGAVLRRVLGHVGWRIAEILGETAAALATGTWDAACQRRLHRDVARLNDAALVAEDQMASHGDAGGAAGTAGERTLDTRTLGERTLGERLFALELAAERVVRAAAVTGQAGGATLARIARLRDALAAARPGPAPPPGASPAGLGIADGTEDALGAALGALEAALAAMWRGGRRNAGEEPQRPAPGPQADGTRQDDRAGADASPPFWHGPLLRQAAQVALATGLAIGCGALISGQRWYWAAIAAYIVGLNVGSRGEALTKAAQRLAGTVAGIVAGIFLASAVTGRTDLTLALVLICAFLAFYAFQVAYGVMIFWITLMVALLYGVLGEFRPALLVLRLEETAAGAAVGVLVQMFVLPVSERAAFAAAMGDFLQALSDAVARAEAGGEALAAAREMDRRAQALRNAVSTLKRGWGRLMPLRRRRAVRAAMRCAYLTRELAQAGRSGGPVLGAADAEAIRRAAGSLRAEIAQPEPAGRALPPDRAGTPLPDIAAGEPGQAGDIPAALRAGLDALRRCVQEM